MLCDYCSDIDYKKLKAGGTIHHKSVAALQKSAQNGCPSCQLIWDCHIDEEGGTLTTNYVGSSHDSQIFMNRNPMGFLEYVQKFRTRNQAKPFLKSVVFICCDKNDPFASRITTRPVDLPPASVDTLLSSKTWLSYCLLNHPYCAQSEDSVLPTRVIDVGSEDGSNAPFLFTTEGRRGQWIALSHCWGGVHPLRTTIENIEEHQKSLPMSLVPPLFLDALRMTRQLGYQFIWIDSLCIIQDSITDWHAESAMMGYIYKHAITTLAAEAAPSSLYLMIDGAHGKIRYPVKVACHENDLKGSVFMFRRPSANAEGPLSTRAWTLQEETLSTRVLRWTKDMLTWHCRTCVCSEVDPTGAFTVGAGGRPNRESLYQTSTLKALCHTPEQFQKRTKEGWTATPSGMQRFTIHSLWDYILKNFMSREITYDSDRLPAISGIVKEVARHTGHRYIAGLWFEKLHADLLWRIDGKAVETKIYTAPSWSWASQSLEKGSKLVTIRESRFELDQFGEVDIIDVSSTLEGPDPYGRIMGAELVIKARAATIDNLRTFASLFDCHLDSSSEFSESQVVCVRIMSFIGNRWYSQLRQEYQDGEIGALILKETGNNAGQYRRIGVVRIPKSDEILLWNIHKFSII